MMNPQADFPVWLTWWNLEPPTFIGFVIIIGGYLLLIGPLRRRFFHPLTNPTSNSIYFLCGLVVILLVQISPLDPISDRYLLSAHMIYHLLITNLAAPLLVLGIPEWWVNSLLRSSIIKKIGKSLTHPVFVFLLFNFNLVIWHYPPMYEAALNDEGIHFIEHAAFLVTSVLFWWPILSPSTLLARIPYPFRVLYLFLGSIVCTLLGAVLAFSPTVLYNTYLQSPPIFNLDPAADQVLAGILMATLDNLFYYGALTVVFFKWVGQEERNASPVH